MTATKNTPSQLPTVPEISIDRFGKDHWSMLLYVESRIVDHKGILNNENLRCDRRINALRAHRGGCSSSYPTRLADGETVSPHDDWSCIEDFVRAGLVVWGGTGMNPVFALTDEGWACAFALRRHRANGMLYADFRWTPAEPGARAPTGTPWVPMSAKIGDRWDLGTEGYQWAWKYNEGELWSIRSSSRPESNFATASTLAGELVGRVRLCVLVRMRDEAEPNGPTGDGARG